MKSINLKVPLAMDSKGNEVLPSGALKGELYFCPDCKGELLFRKGNIKKPHFAHKVVPAICDFLTETEKHYYAKVTVANSINGRKNVKLVRICSKCKKEEFIQQIPSKVKQATLEYILPSGHRADVAFLDEEGQLLAIIEIMETHRVDDEKELALKGRPWAEFLADSVLSSSEWKPDRDFFKPCLCERCKAIRDFGTVTTFSGQHKKLVQCPMTGRGFVDAVSNCSSCAHFVNVNITKKGIFCIGKRANETG